MHIFSLFVAACLELSLIVNGTAHALSIDPVQPDADTGENFNRYQYAHNNPYRYVDPDGRLPVPIPIVVGVGLLLTTGDANSPAPGQATRAMPPGEAAGRFVEAFPAGKLGATFKAGADASELTQRAATREAKRQAGIPTSQQPISQTNGRVDHQTPVGRQQTFEVPVPGGGKELRSVQVSRDIRGDHAGMPQIEAGVVKPHADPGAGGRPKLQNTNKVRVDFEPE